jgi:hypothetical protein
MDDFEHLQRKIDMYNDELDRLNVERDKTYAFIDSLGIRLANLAEWRSAARRDIRRLTDNNTEDTA